MKLSTLVVSLMAIPLAMAAPCPWTPVCAEPSGADAIQALVRRRLPENMHGLFEFHLEGAAGNSSSGFDAFEVTAHKDKVHIMSATTPGLSRGLLTYLRSIGGDIFWSGDTFTDDLLARVEEAHISGASWAEVRYFLNVVTYSYTTAFYDFDKWEYLLDWASLHGITMPLAIGGQEYIWAEVYRDFGLKDDVILPYYTGPAFHGWGRMGNIRGSWGGNTTQDWLDKQWDLQKKMVARMVALGMTPVLPGFSGFLPAELQDIIGGPKFLQASVWNKFPDQYTKDHALDPTWPTFNQVQKAFLDKQIELYGGWTSHHYSIDLYNELRPTSTDPAYLKNNSANVIGSLKAVDKDAVWVMQGWLFVNDPKNWTPTAMKAFLGEVADDDLLILDLASESLAVWSQPGKENFFGKKWVWNTLLNYGQNNGLYGALEHYNDLVMTAKEMGGNIVGVGITPEGLNNNEIIYEMALDAPWTDKRIDLEQWKTEWINRRYQLHRSELSCGKDAVQKAWTILDNSVYKSNNLKVQCTTRSVFDLVPDVSGLFGTTGNYLATKITFNTSDVVDALDLMLQAVELSPHLEHVPAFSYDLVDVARQVLLDAGIPMYLSMIASWNKNNMDDVGTQGSRIVDLLKDTDKVLATDKNFLLAEWIADAREWGADDKAKDFMEFEARNQLILWGPATFAPWMLDRYAAKHWHGVMGAVFAPTWDKFTKYLQAHPTGSYSYKNWTTELQAFESEWEDEIWGQNGESWSTVGSPVATIKAARTKWDQYLRVPVPM